MIMDGQFVKMRPQLDGSCLVEAGDRNEAIEIAARIPAESWVVEIRPVVEISICGGELGAANCRFHTWSFDISVAPQVQ